MTLRHFLSGLAMAQMPVLALAAETQVAPMAGSAGSVFQVVFGLILVVMLILGLSWLSKRMGITKNFGASPMKVLGSVSLGGRERAVLIEVNDTWVVAGVATGQVNALATLPRGVLPDPSSTGVQGFTASFKSIIEKAGHAK